MHETVNVLTNYRFVGPGYTRPDGGAWWPINDPEAVTAFAAHLAERATSLTLAAVKCAQAGHAACGSKQTCEVTAQLARSEVQTTTRTRLIKEFVGWLDPLAAGVATGAGPGTPG